jgi:hypothetical protein
MDSQDEHGCHNHDDENRRNVEDSTRRDQMILGEIQRRLRKGGGKINSEIVEQ